jgi:uncharacterized membrane protein
VMGFGLVSALGVISSVVAVYVFGSILPRRKGVYVELAERIEGFKMFLTAMERYITGVKMPFPDRFTMYESYLPFAIALDVEPEWSAQFSDMLSQLELEHRSLTGISSASGGMFSGSSFCSSFASTISSASSNPSSSSGSSSGSSGGGGGGGGGGGW